MGLIDEKNQRLKILCYCPLKGVGKLHLNGPKVGTDIDFVNFSFNILLNYEFLVP